ncbi:MAG: BamA/TamA family outer membrane protein [Draconibacterium sp.]|nr:BamA/TamA family outer membrane protein [Draconibacterium sp.]
MKKSVILLLLCFMGSVVFAQEKDAKKEVVKEGWNFGALPTITFDTDLGFQYGALVNLFNYGDGSRYPKYNHSLYFEVSRYTKGSGINRFYFDSDKLLKGLRTTVDLSYLSDQAYDFFGYNGYDAVVNYDWIDDADPNYKSRMFYKYDRKMFRFKVDLQGNIKGENLKWIGGFNLLNFKLGSVDIEKLNKGEDESDKLPSVSEQPGLYEKYKEWEIISDKEANGGFVPALKAGLVYDSRDNRPNPMKGIWTEAVIEGAPEFLGAESSFTKMSITHRQYFTIIKDDLSFAYRLNYQTSIGGHTPFYYQTQVLVSELKGASSEGLGGGSTMRGISRNRVMGDGYFLGNVEARWKFVRFRFINNNFYLGLNGFMDFGQVTKKCRELKMFQPAI